MHGLTLSDRTWRWLRAAAVGLYLLWSGLLIQANPGFQYDEGLMVLGSVHLLHSSGELTLPHDPDTWVCPRGFCFPLMTVRYVGAIKEYLALPLFALFGSSAEVVRILSMLLGAIGVWGIATLIGETVSLPAGAAVAGLIAISPAYVDLTVFDNGAIATSMAALGLVALGLSGYLRRQSAWAAFWFGCACGLGIWARANFTWLLAALLLASAVTLPRSMLRIPVRHWAAWVAGGVTAGLPFLAYQVVSKGGTLQALGMFVSHSTLSERLTSRWRMLAEVLLSDREHRAMWNGPELPGWQRWDVLGVVLAAALMAVCIRSKASGRIQAPARIAVLVFVILAGFLFSSRLEVAEHHLVLLLPIAAVVAVLGFSVLLLRYRQAWPLAALLALAYVGAALYWQVSAVQGLNRTGGVGQWSDAVYSLADTLQDQFQGREVKVLDWGLQNNLYVITGGRVRSREIYPDVTDWSSQVQAGGLFLLTAAGNRFFPEASLGFLAALKRDQPESTRYEALQRQGAGYAELFDVAPGTAALLATGQLEGFYPVEENRWRWTRKDFAVVSSSQGARLTLELFLPDYLLRKQGPITLSGQVNGHALPAETFTKPGPATWTREVPSAWLQPGSNRFAFSLDKALPPSPQDGRQLGLIVISATLSAR